MYIYILEYYIYTHIGYEYVDVYIHPYSTSTVRRFLKSVSASALIAP